MGYVLRRELREALGPQITGLQRLVALEVADDANDQTRMSYATLEDLVRWTGAKDGKVVRTVLKRLAEAGWEFRVPIGKGSDGRTLYAVPGKALTFRVPESSQGVTPVTPSVKEGVTGVASETTGVTPLSSAPQTFSPLSGSARIVRSAAVMAEREREKSPLVSKILKDHPGSTTDEAAAVLASMRRDPKIHSVSAVVSSAAGKEDVSDRLRKLRAGSQGVTPVTPSAALPECAACRDPIWGPLAADGLCRECRGEVVA